jgi:hypothetical protein
MILEIWKSVTNYEGLYEVSNFGTVRMGKFKHHKGWRVEK